MLSVQEQMSTKKISEEILEDKVQINAKINERPNLLFLKTNFCLLFNIQKSVKKILSTDKRGLQRDLSNDTTKISQKLVRLSL
jgi:hypothetical protein